MRIPRILLVFALSASPLAGALPADLPERVARLNYVEGQVEFQEAGQPPRWTLPDRAFLEDDRLTTRPEARAEIALGSATLRLDERTTLTFETLDADRVLLRVEQGTAVVTLRDLADDETFAVETPNTTLTLLAPGEYRVEVPVEGVSALTVHDGAAEAATAGGPVRVADGQRVRFEGAQALATLEPVRPSDDFDAWILDREVQLADAEAPPNMESPVLEQYGEWQDDPTYGRVWMPSYASGGYDPFGYSYGSWQYVGYGWNWVDPYPWSRYTSYGGRWVYLDHARRWCWTPPRHREPVVSTLSAPHPFGLPRKPVKSRASSLPVTFVSAQDDDRPGASPRETEPRMPRAAPGHPTRGTFVPSAPPAPSPVHPTSTPSRPATDSGTASRPAGAQASRSAARREAVSPTYTPAPASRESGAIAPP